MNTPLVITIALAIAVLIGFLIGRTKGRPALGAILGIFGIIGWIIIALIPRRSTV